MILNLPFNRQLRRILLPEMLEPLYAKGLTRAEVAKELGVGYKYLSRRIAESLSLYEAEKRGQLAFAASVLEANQ